MARKTISVLTILEKANKYLACDGPRPTPEHRLGAASLLERILMDSGNYAGYGYLAAHPDGTLRAERVSSAPMATPEEVAAGDYDPTRRHYYYSRTLAREREERDAAAAK